MYYIYNIIYIILYNIIYTHIYNHMSIFIVNLLKNGQTSIVSPAPKR